MERLAGRIILLWGWQRALLALGAGAIAVLTQPPYDFFAAGFLAFPILVWLVDGATGAGRTGLTPTLRAAFGVGWWFGFGYFVAGLWWTGAAVLVEADSFAWALPFAVLGIPFLLAFFYGLATAVARLFWSDGLGRILALAFGFGLAEWLRGFAFTGFPWNAVGYAAMPTPLAMQSVHLLTLDGVNTLAVLVFAMPALLAAPRHRVAGFTLALMLVAVHLGYGLWAIGRPVAEEGRQSLAVRAVQPNVPMDQKWDKASEQAVLQTLLKLSAEPPAAGEAKPSLIVWPETAVPFVLAQRPDALASVGDSLADGQMLLAGAVRSEGTADDVDGLVYNSVVAVDDKGVTIDAVDKVHLVPFGEYLPFGDLLARIGLTQLVAGPMNFQAGANRHAIALPGGRRAIPFICYEVIFPGLVAEGAAAADLIVNVTNDAWFGNTPGPYQHLRMAQVRAVETGLPIVRAANTGISAIIDERGRIVDALALGAQGRIDAEITVGPAGGTPVPFPDAGYVIMAATALLAAGLRILRR